MKRTTTILLLFTVLLQCTFAQRVGNAETPRNSLDNMIIRTAIKQSIFPEERVYLHFDNTAYYLGEEIWFKAYVTSGVNDEPTTMSRILYVELVAPEGYVVRTNKYKIGEDGSCHGSFELNQLLLSGYYEVRAYTRYMLNRGKDAIFSRVFPIFDKVNADNWDFKNMLDRRRAFLVDIEEDDSLTGLDRKMRWENGKLPEWDIKFYPEGGHLVDGIESIVAYEVFGNDGINSGQSITITADGEPLFTATPEHLGKGTFTFIPRRDTRYRGILRVGKKEIKFDLPQVEEEGAVINIREQGDTYYIKARNNFKTAIEMGCAVMRRGKVYFYESFSSTDSTMLFAIDRNTLGEGVNRVVIFVNNSIPLAERQFFVTHKEPQAGDKATARLKVTSNGESLDRLVATPHSKITLEIGREDDKPITNGNFSLSVSDADYREQTSYTYNLYSYMLLGSEIKGYIPDAARYFDPKNGNRHHELDLIMLTHGWTSYDWSKLSTQDGRLEEPIERGITIKGNFIKKTPERSWGKYGKINLSKLPNETINFEITYNDTTLTRYSFKTDINGEFNIRTNDFIGKRVAKLIPSRRCSIYDNDSTVSFVLDRYFSPAMRLYDYWERNCGTPITFEQITRHNDSIIKIRPFEYLISPIEVTTKKKRESNYRPPRSEMRVDFLDEWEYAQDVTYLCNEKSNWYKGDTQLSNISETPPQWLNPAMYDPNPELSQFDYSVMPTGMYGTGNRREHTIKGSGFSVTDKGTFQINDPAYYNTITAADILRSAFWRHNFNWCYWIQSMVTDSCYDSHSVPLPDEEYLKGISPGKMLDFKEIVIRSDEKIRRQFGNDDRRLRTREKSRYNVDYSSYYEGFYKGMFIDARNGNIDDAPDAITLDQNIKHMSRDAIPNYVACFVPNTETDRQTSIIPILTRPSSTRYTMVYGYSESKQFYSPDYSNMKPGSYPADYRRTLLWVPYAKSNDGKITVELYNNSSTRNITVDVEGYADGTFYSNTGNITTRDKDTETHGASEIVLDVTPIMGIHNIDLLAYCFKQTEEGRNLFRHGMYNEAFVKFNEASALGYPDAIYNTGVCHMNGYGTEPDSIEAFHHFKRAGNVGHAKALHNLAVCHLKGIGTEKNDSLAITTYRKAAITGYTRSQIALADCYLNGIGSPKDSTAAFEWYRIAAANNEPRALYIIAEQLAIADSTAALDKRALRKSSTIEYYKKAAKEGNADAQYRLAEFYRTGRYVRKNKKEAFNWYLHAANNNHPLAAEQVAVCYEKGRGTKKNEKKAVRWYRIALQNGSELAKEKIDWYDKMHFLE